MRILFVRRPNVILRPPAKQNKTDDDLVPCLSRKTEAKAAPKAEGGASSVSDIIPLLGPLASERECRNDGSDHSPNTPFDGSGGATNAQILHGELLAGLPA